MNRIKKILIVEDDHDTRVLYRKALEAEGFTVHSTTNGKNGLEKLKQFSSTIKVILLDINMPIMDGNEFLKVKSADPKLGEIPVIVITSQPNSVLYPVYNIIQKPPDIPGLIKTVKSFLP